MNDSHLFIKNLGFSEGNIDCIPNNEEKYIGFSKKIRVKSYTKKLKNEEGEPAEKEIKVYHTIRFIDSFKFMATSLDKLVNNLPKHDFINLGLYYSSDKFNLLTRKGVYLYEYMDSLEKLEETKLPRKNRFIRDIMMGVSAMRIIHMLKKYGGRLKWNILKTITNYIIKLMFYF